MCGRFATSLVLLLLLYSGAAMGEKRKPSMVATISRLIVATLFSSLAVERLVDFAKRFVRQVRVDLRRRDVRVAEELLHGAEVGAVH